MGHDAKGVLYFMRLILLLLLLPFAVIAKLLGFGRSNMVDLPLDHPEMAQAIAEARTNLPEFRRFLETPDPGMENFAIKAAFPTGKNSEHIWVNTLKVNGSGFSGNLANDPRDLPGMAIGSPVEISEEMVSDWAYSSGGVFRGHFTTRVLLPHMSKRMRRQVEAMFGWA